MTTVHDLDQAILVRRSIRQFLPKPVPKELLFECLELAQRSPSNSNIQPWQLFIVSGAAHERLRVALLEEAHKGSPNIPPLPERFKHFRSKLGAYVYGEGMGIAREAIEERKAAVIRNWEFFGAPLVAIVCIDKELGNADILGVGMYLQTLILALTARGLGTCVQVALAGYPDIVRKELKIPPEFNILCGVSIGYPDLDFRANNLDIWRSPIDQNVVYLED